MELFLPAISDVGTRFSIPSLVFITRMTQAFSQRFSQASAVGARLWGFHLLPVAGGQKLLHPAISDHVTTATQNHDVIRLIVAWIPVFVMTLRGGFSTIFTVAQFIFATCSIPLAVCSGIISFPKMMGCATWNGKLSSVFAIGARVTCLALIDIAGFTEAARQRLVGLSAICACVHCTIVHPRVSYSKLKRAWAKHHKDGACGWRDEHPENADEDITFE